ncbi:MAG: hypothetical protein HY241_14585 [Actinobacteria bacterium]|nr:hypothetical protein [Actinomycetota bacterium]
MTVRPGRPARQAEVHHGRARTVRAAREQTMTAARAAHPERFTTPRVLPKILDLPDTVWINKPPEPNQQDQKIA